MTRQPNILLICHNRMAIPALQYLHREQALAAVAVPDLYDFVHQPFLELAHQLNVPFTTLNKATYRQELKELMDRVRPDAVFVISFPWLIPVNALPQCPYGFLNFHGGLLPEMRGSDPMFHCIRNSIYTTGLTVHQINEGVDTGDIVLREAIEIGTETTHGMLSSQIAYACEKLATTLLAQIRTGQPLVTTPQDETKAAYIPKPVPEDTFINWDTMTAAQVKALVNACNPQLKGATTIYNNWKFGITHVTGIDLTGDTGQIRPGTILYNDPEKGLIIFCKDGKAVRLDITYTEEGYFPGYRLAMFGLNPGTTFMNLTPTPIGELV